MSAKTIAVSLVAGLFAGLMSGLLGVGGGIVMVPLLVGAAGLGQHKAQASSLAAIVPIAAVSAAIFAFDRSVDYRVAALLAAGTLVGAPLGARLMARSSEGLLKLLFGLLVVAIAVQTLWS